MCMKLLLFVIVVSCMLLNIGCDREPPGDIPPLTYMIYINRTAAEIGVKTYNFYPPSMMEILIRTIKSQDSLVLIRSSNDFTASDSVDIIFNNQRMLRYHRNNANTEKWSIYNMQEYETFVTSDYSKEIYRITDRHLGLAEDIGK